MRAPHRFHPYLPILSSVYWHPPSLPPGAPVAPRQKNPASCLSQRYVIWTISSLSSWDCSLGLCLPVLHPSLLCHLPKEAQVFLRSFSAITRESEQGKIRQHTGLRAAVSLLSSPTGVLQVVTDMEMEGGAHGFPGGRHTLPISSWWRNATNNGGAGGVWRALYRRRVQREQSDGMTKKSMWFSQLLLPHPTEEQYWWEESLLVSHANISLGCCQKENHTKLLSELCEIYIRWELSRGEIRLVNTRVYLNTTSRWLKDSGQAINRKHRNTSPDSLGPFPELTASQLSSACDLF